MSLSMVGVGFEQITTQINKLMKDAMAERLRRKAELQKKAAQPSNFKEGLKGEFEKQKEMSRKSKDEKREDLCELLGRGC